MSQDANASADACPVDHKTREAWLQQARHQQQQTKTMPASSILAGDSCDSSTIDQSTASKPAIIPKFTRFSLDTSREVSTIPRAITGSSPATTLTSSSASAAPASHGSRAANNEQETGADSKSGNWIYPSEQMFFDAMRRKNYDPQAEDMRSIIPIHNAVNERAWKEIKEWERGRGADTCGGPKLVSFSGQSTALTPKARLNSILGYAAPFDRHDWVVDRCGTNIDYVIDFYAGKDEGRKGKSLNFYLDVRPKLNSWEGVKMRAGRLVGL
ncbi:Cytochrome c1 heme lyase [Elasticomyces elasticus]|nr:Cytochrome c1 heme lyase [Elasticomyces elasticus]